MHARTHMNGHAHARTRTKTLIRTKKHDGTPTPKYICTHVHIPTPPHVHTGNPPHTHTYICTQILTHSQREPPNKYTEKGKNPLKIQPFKYYTATLSHTPTAHTRTHKHMPSDTEMKRGRERERRSEKEKRKGEIRRKRDRER